MIFITEFITCSLIGCDIAIDDAPCSWAPISAVHAADRSIRGFDAGGIIRACGNPHSAGATGRVSRSAVMDDSNSWEPRRRANATRNL